MCARARRGGLAAAKVFETLSAMMQRQAARHACDVLAACLMPDHMHVTLRGTDDSADAWAAAVRFKQQTGVWFARKAPHIRWQKDFYDHILRRDEDLPRYVRYILENPVRAGLTEDWREYECSYAHPELGLGKDPPPATTAD
ncbi:MAG: transposase [Armatimonadota bacterium]